MRNFWRDLFYAVATGAILGHLIGTYLRRKREREAYARLTPPPPPPPRPRPPVLPQSRKAR